ncbi:hypothetical protein [Bacillus sp. B-jedd]|nr:hypothetical protein [Bacillus sp. B-jedd]
MGNSSITIQTAKTVVTSMENGEILKNSELEVGKEYIVTIQLTTVK